MISAHNTLVKRAMSKLSCQVENPITQTVDAVKALLAYMHRPAEPLPLFVALNDRVRLTLSKDGKGYYLTTPKNCSCPARTFNPGTTCKHMKALQASIEEREDESIMPGMSQPFRPYVDDGPVIIRTASGEAA